jgi:hypothetical protein
MELWANDKSDEERLVCRCADFRCADIEHLRFTKFLKLRKSCHRIIRTSEIRTSAHPLTIFSGAWRTHQF